LYLPTRQLSSAAQQRILWDRHAQLNRGVCAAHKDVSSGFFLDLFSDCPLNLTVCRSVTILPAISLRGVLKTLVVEGGVTAEMFDAFIEGLLDVMNPYPGPRSVLVIDICPTHHSEHIEEMVEARYVHVLCL
jgi:hypothetical protein